MGYSKRLFICPYYVRDYRNRMSCEGGVVQIADAPATVRYMDRYCASYDWERCTLAQALNDFYEGDGKK